MTTRGMEPHSFVRRAVSVIGTTLLALALTSCDELSKQQAETNNPKAEGQTLARVNGQEITEHELRAELNALPDAAPEDDPELTRKVLRRMVQRTVLAQKAEEKKLHRTPEVMMELRRKRSQILARAYIADAMARQLPVSKYDVEDFIEQHPHYFSNRKHYVFDQVLIPNKQATKSVINSIKDLKTLDEIETALSDLDVDYIRRLNSNLGNQFPKEAVMKMDRLNPEEIFLARARDHAVISKIVDSRPQPIVGFQAREIARRLLVTQRDAMATRKLIDSLLATAQIDFLGEFATMPVFENNGESDSPLEDGTEVDKEKGPDEPGAEKENEATEDEKAASDGAGEQGGVTVSTAR